MSWVSRLTLLERQTNQTYKRFSEQKLLGTQGTYYKVPFVGSRDYSLVPLGAKTQLTKNLDGILKSRDITLPTQVRTAKVVVFPVVINRCKMWVGHKEN